MGCDIHTYTEVKYNGEWVLLTQGHVRRSYVLFTCMAGVRGDKEDVLFEPRGLPEDISVGTRMFRQYDGSEAHTFSWLTQDELKQCLVEVERRCKSWYSESIAYQEISTEFGYLFGNGIEESIGEYTQKQLPELTDVRVVFWFDN